jgi:hypothetical protein
METTVVLRACEESEHHTDLEPPFCLFPFFCCVFSLAILASFSPFHAAAAFHPDPVVSIVPALLMYFPEREFPSLTTAHFALAVSATGMAAHLSQ